jgi:NADH-quinone oxidoreductase subunit L
MAWFLGRVFSLDVMPFLALFLPLGGFLALSLFEPGIRRDKEERGAGILACTMVLLSFAASVWTALHVGEGARAMAEFRAHFNLPPRASPYMPYQPSIGLDWIDVSGLHIPFALLMDRLSAVMTLVVTGIGSLIHIYSLGYMAHDEDRVRYFSYLNLFTFFMLLLVMAGNLPVMFIGWEGVGLCSYLLIGFWYKKKSAADAGKKAFIVNRIGDAGLILGMIAAFHYFGTLHTFGLTEGAGALAPEKWGEFGPLTVVALLLVVGACGKSAQIPLHVWLPDAMEGPTPVSALIHAATMVTAGVYMVARLAPVYAHSETAMVVVAVVGTATSLMAATIALVQTDIKKVLAWSTISQLGYMFLACGVGAFGVAVFHLFTHAFFKALLFLGSGSVIHAMGGEQDMRKMGGLARRIPWTFGTFVVGTLAIAGIPPLAGYFSKDAILASALAEGHTLLFGVGLATALLTSFYMARLLFLTFFGPFRGSHDAEHHLHESPWVMLAPLVVLAAGSAVAGFVPVPDFLAEVFRLPASEEHHAAWLPVVATVVAVLGIAGAYWAYLMLPDIPARVGARLRPVQRVLENKYGFDLAYDGFARGVVSASRKGLWESLDAGVIDGAVNGAGRLTAGLSRAVRLVQTGLVRGYALLILGGAATVLGYLLWAR